MTRASTSHGESRLERRYRWLIALHPRAHRDAYGDEMLGVALAAAGPDRRRPAPRDAIDLTVTALRMRLGAPLADLRGETWSAAAASVGTMLAIGIAATEVFSIAETSAEALRWHDRPFYPLSTLVMAVAWTLTAVAAGIGLRRSAAAGAVTALALSAVAHGMDYAWSPSGLVEQWWHLVLAAATTVALLVAVARPGAEGRTPRPLPIGAALTVVYAAVAVIASAFATGPTDFPTPPGFHQIGTTTLAAVLVMAVANAIVVWRLGGPVRRRFAVVLAPVVATIVMVALTFGGFTASSPRFNPPVPLVAPQWIALFGVPAGAFYLALLWLRRHEERLDLVEAGRSARAAGSMPTTPGMP